MSTMPRKHASVAQKLIDFGISDDQICYDSKWCPLEIPIFEQQVLTEQPALLCMVYAAVHQLCSMPIASTQPLMRPMPFKVMDKYYRWQCCENIGTFDLYIYQATENVRRWTAFDPYLKGDHTPSHGLLELSSCFTNSWYTHGDIRTENIFA